MNGALPRDYPPFLVDLAEQVAAQLARHKVAPRRAQEIGFDLAEYMRCRWGGSQIYIPRGQKIALAERDRELRRRFNGRNQRELAEENGLTLTRVYQILARSRRD